MRITTPQWAVPAADTTANYPGEYALDWTDNRADGWVSRRVETACLDHRETWLSGRGLRWLLVAFVVWVGVTQPQAAYAQQPEDAFSVYMTMPDGVKLAADVHLPERTSATQKVPVLLHLTRYWRSARKPMVANPALGIDSQQWQNLPALSPTDQQFVANGYAIVKVDVRGTGASYGSRPIEWGPVEVSDGYNIVEWVVNQPWADGNVGAYGISYSAATASFLTTNQHPALKAIAPWSGGYLDHYKTYVKPFGLSNNYITLQWGTLVKRLDNHDWKKLGRGVRPVDSDTDGAMLAEAIAQHTANADVYKDSSPIQFSDDPSGDSGLTLQDISTASWKDKIEASNVAMFKMSSWLDAGTADSNLLQFNNFSNPQKLLILGSGHGGRNHASPYVVKGEVVPPVPSALEQWGMAVTFFDHYLKGIDNGVEQWPAIRYFNFGEEAFKTTDVWPPAGARTARLYLGGEHRLSADKPLSDTGEDSYTVNVETTTGSRSRWMTQVGYPVLNLDDRGEMDQKMLGYTGQPLATATQITGHPTVTLYAASTHPDGALIAYLEDVDENGNSTYITEGGLRVIHRKISQNPYLSQATPYHSFKRADAKPMVPGEVVELSFEMMPTSVLVKRGHRIRLSIAGADKDNFDPIPVDATPTFKVARNARFASFIELPVIDKR